MIIVAAPGLASAQAAPTGMAASRTQVFWNDAGQLWAGSLAPETCDQEITLTTDAMRPTARTRIATLERRGEIVGEVRVPQTASAKALSSARTCALEASGQTTAPVLITSGAAGFTRFHSAFAACMVKADAGAAMGSMTLWIDQRCNW